MNVWLGIIYFGQRDGFLGTAEGVTGVCILEFDDRTDVAGPKGRDADPGLAVELIDLADLLGAAARAVVKFAAEFHRPRINAEERELAELRLAHRFEDVE